MGRRKGRGRRGGEREGIVTLKPGCPRKCLPHICLKSGDLAAVKMDFPPHTRISTHIVHTCSLEIWPPKAVSRSLSTTLCVSLYSSVGRSMPPGRGGGAWGGGGGFGGRGGGEGHFGDPGIRCSLTSTYLRTLPPTLSLPPRWVLPPPLTRPDDGVGHAAGLQCHLSTPFLQGKGRCGRRCEQCRQPAPQRFAPNILGIRHVRRPTMKCGECILNEQ